MGNQTGSYPVGLLAVSGGPATFACSAAANWLALGFAAPAKTISKVLVYCSAVGGTLGASDLAADLYADSGAGQPAASATETRTTVTATPTGAQWVEFTGFTTALSADQQYWIVLRNANGVPATNFPTYQWTNGGVAHFSEGGGTGRLGFEKLTSTNSGSTWSSLLSGAAGLRIEFNDGTFIGYAFDNAGTTLYGNGAYSTNEDGVKFTTPANARLRVAGIAAALAKSGSPASNVRFRLYNGTSLVATSNGSPLAGIPGNTWLRLYFPSVQTIEPSTLTRLAIGVASGGDASNRYRVYAWNVQNSAGSKGTLPFGSWVGTAYNGSSWTDTDTVAPAMALLLDTDTPYDVLSGSGLPPALWE